MRSVPIKKKDEICKGKEFNIIEPLAHFFLRSQNTRFNVEEDFLLHKKVFNFLKNVNLTEIFNFEVTFSARP